MKLRDQTSKTSRPNLTLRDVSEASGVSEMTVSRVLRKRGDVSAKTRARVLEAARSLGYVPNKIAGSLASSRVNLVGVIIPSLSNMVFPEVMMGISKVLDSTELQPVVGVTDYHPEKAERVIFEMLSWRPSGLIVAGLEHTDAARLMMHNAGIPIAEIMDVDGDPIDYCIGISHFRAGSETARQILDRGYKKIGFLGTKMPLDHRARKRLDGFKSVLNEAGVSIAAEEHYSGGSALLKGRQMTEAILESHPDLDFLYYSNDMIGAGGLLYCLEKGYSIPDEIGLAGFNGLEMIDGLPRKLATMDSCRLEIGTTAAEIIAAEASGGPVPHASLVEITPRFDPADTVR